ncbi:MAG: hypothetical protein RIM33_07010 [Alphaproteobacteria bacterium]
MHWMFAAKRTVGPALALMTGLGIAASPVHAQEEADPLTVPGRYEVVSVEDGEDGGQIAIMVDTAFGRTWILETNADGSVNWRRIFVRRAGDTPDGFTSRPLTIRP